MPPDEVRHAVLIAGDRWLVPTSSARFVNHACAPNCVVDDDLALVTTEPVGAGDQLTIRYDAVTAAEWLDEPAAHFWHEQWSFDCRCGTPHCVGRVDRYRITGYDDGPPITPGTKLRLGLSPGRGRGVFATAPIRAGETFERAPVIVSPAAEWSALQRTVLFHHTFSWGPGLEHAAIALGYGSLFNHSYSPDARFILRLDALLIDFVALRDLAPGEEIFVNYHGDPTDRDPLWFDVH